MKSCDLLLLNLAKCYYRGALAFTLEPNDVEAMTWDWQQKFLDLTVNSDLLKKYPLRSSFTQMFFKLIITSLENHEIHNDMYQADADADADIRNNPDMYTQLVQSMNNSNGNSFSYHHYIIGNDLSDVITIKETNQMVVNGTTGMRTWEAALMLADWALYNKEVFSDKRVLELGSGVGFTGVTIAKHCMPQSIYLTDCHSKVLSAICDNIRINFPDFSFAENEDDTIFRNDEREIGAMILDWNAIENLSSSIVPDVVIGSDIVYDPTIIQPLCEMLLTLFQRNKELNVYIASVVRNHETFNAFLNCLGSMNLKYEMLPLPGSVFIEWDQKVKQCLLQINC